MGQTDRNAAARTADPRSARRAGGVAAAALAAALALGGPSGAQSVTDGSDGAIGAERARAVLALATRQLRSPDARITALRAGRGETLCGAVDVKNRMGTYVGPRGFVADLAEGFFGLLPEGPELRNPASMADFQAMERAKALFAAHCGGG